MTETRPTMRISPRRLKPEFRPPETTFPLLFVHLCFRPLCPLLSTALEIRRLAPLEIFFISGIEILARFRQE